MSRTPASMTGTPAGREATLVLERAEELLEPLVAGRRGGVRVSGATDWDAVGAVLGEPGVLRLLRILQADSTVTQLLLRIDGPGNPGEPIEVEALSEQLRSWCRARIAVNDQGIRTSRRIGVRMLAIFLGVLGLFFAAAWLLQHEPIWGPPGPLRTVAAEALVIAGWVVMWRPIELLVFEPLRPRIENRLLARALALPIRMESTGPSDASGARAKDRVRSPA